MEVEIAVGFFEAVINVVEWSYFEGMRVRNVFLQYYLQVLSLLKCKVYGYFSTKKKSSPNRGSPLNSSIDKTKFTEMTNGKLQFTFCFSNSTIDIMNFITFS